MYLLAGFSPPQPARPGPAIGVAAGGLWTPNGRLAMASLGFVERVQQSELALVGVAYQMPVRGVDLLERRAHAARQGEQVDAGGDGFAGVDVAHVFGGEPDEVGGAEGGCPV